MQYIVFSLLFLVGQVYGLTAGKVVKFKGGEYKNLSITQDLKRKLSSSSRISFTIMNSTKKNKVFFLVFEDQKSVDYWTRLNFKTTLAPGENQLDFDLKRYLGERGSNKVNRRLDFKTLKKAFVYVEESSGLFDTPYELRNVSIYTQKELKVREGIKLFSFGNYQRGDLPRAFKLINDKTLYGKQNPHGFVSIDLWRSSDDQLAPFWYSKTLGVNKAVFRMTLPPGEYVYRLIWDRVGYWDVPFWKKRKLFINEFPEIVETRSDIDDFMKDYLSNTIEPPFGEHPYDFHLKRILRPMEGEFTVKGSSVDFQFSGDASGVSLNTLMVWPKAMNKAAKKLIVDLDSLGKKHFSQKYRMIKSKKDSDLKKRVGAVGFGEIMSPRTKCSSIKKHRVVTAKNGRVGIDLCIKGDPSKSIKIALGELKSSNSKITQDKWKIYKYKYRFKSIDLNHETYGTRVEELNESKNNEFNPNGHDKTFYHLSLSDDKFVPGVFKGDIEISQGKWKEIIKMNLHVLNQEYESPVINAGTIGLSPFPKTYFNADDLNLMDLKYHFKAKEKLKDIGLKAFTDVPGPKISYDQSFKKFKLDMSEISRLVHKSEMNDVFLYNGNFPKQLLNGHFRNASQTEKSFNDNRKSQFKKILEGFNGKGLVYLYSDEAAGYRNAVKEDLELGQRIKKKLPGIKIGGFGSLYDWEKAKELYKTWDFGLYGDIPSKHTLRRLNKLKQNYGLYNLCAGPEEDLTFCFGPLLFRLQASGIKYYFEWHASAIHNYPGYDLDGREADIAFFYPSASGEISITRRYVMASQGMEVFKKLNLLKSRLVGKRAKGLNDRKALAFLKKLEGPTLFPIYSFKNYRESLQKLIKQNLDDLLLSQF